MNPPKWAQELTLKTLLYLKEQGYDVEVPVLNWRHTCKNFTAGGAYSKSRGISISASPSRNETKLTLLHELAHWALDEPHTPRFWDLAWQLYRWAKLPIRYCKQQEGNYKQGAMAAYRRSVRRKV